ncbi:hypothetical protein MPTK1_1g12080 [Marchantia polymorpha subsp. ruderalis]|uniref:Uncharacterized protein n=2 Tax=Marchantia polymorpha TaxID=3197 RepID=A0A176W569_MARPO|nr:hypothetical protein AXG93_3137s1120 [Marchantia polymorpha subsp. ruderalis]PTQ45463.1 hypothetical protein MARPO_0014s0020 [Marchantia polymorpha]BBM98259.1 hypothetical protein Mp_1g12080 [Marchantia polymorpha subsp. ruderalis]|eukprot:PTQ45463.1 hypothetical protein MARPO_0014s0020 [Marchantia polymorpha]
MLSNFGGFVRVSSRIVPGRRLGAVSGVVDATGVVGVGVGVGVGRRERLGNWHPRKSWCSSVTSGISRGVLEKHFGTTRTGRAKTRTMSMTEGAAEVTESGYVASDAGGGEGVNGVAGVSLQQPGDSSVVVDHGFTRPEMRSEPLVGTVMHYERHLFLCYKDPESWPARVEAADNDRLPRFFVAALRARKNDMPKKTRLTICEGRDGTESSSGDVLIFPEKIRYRGLTHFDVDSFVEDVLVKGKDWVGSSKPEPLLGSYIFVCAHGTRDARCGVCGPALIQKLHEDIAARGLENQIFVRPCSHIGGHKYAGNVIIFSTSASGQVSGHWYGYVVPEDVPALLDQHIGKGEIIERLWRGQMGLAEDDQKLAHEERLRCQQEGTSGCPCAESQVRGPDGEGESATPCCQTLKTEVAESAEATENGFSDQTNGEIFDEPESSRSDLTASPKVVQSVPESEPVKGRNSSFLRLPKWVQTWEREDTHAALAVLGVAALVTVAFHIHKRSASS